MPGEAWPVFHALRQGGQSRNGIEVIRIKLAHHIQHPDRLGRILQTRLIEIRQSPRDLQTRLGLRIERQVSFQGPGHALGVIQALAEIGDGRQGLHVLIVVLAKDRLVAFDRSGGIIELVRHETGLPNQHRLLGFGVLGDRRQTIQILDGFPEFQPDLRVIDQQFERLWIVPVGQDEQQAFTSRLRILQHIALSYAGLSAQGHPLLRVLDSFGSLQQKAHHLGVLLIVRVDLLQSLRVGVIARVEFRGLLQPLDCCRVIPRPPQIIGNDRAELGLTGLVLGQSHLFIDRRGCLAPRTGLHETTLRSLEQLDIRSVAGRLHIGLTGAQPITGRLPQSPELLVELSSGALLRDGTDVVCDGLRCQIESLPLFEVLDRGHDGGLVVRQQRGNSRPSLTGRHRIVATLFVDLGNRPLGGDAPLHVFFLLRLLLQDRDQIVPTPRPL